MRKVTLCVLSFSLMLLMQNVARACSCDIPYIIGDDAGTVVDPVEYEKEHAAAVFSGIVTEVIIDEASKTYEAKFKVQTSWKDVDTEEVSLFGSTVCCVCVFQFKAGESYLVYAHNFERRGQRVLGASVCSRTTKLKNAGDDLKVLGTGRIPKDSKLSHPGAKPNNSFNRSAK